MGSLDLPKAEVSPKPVPFGAPNIPAFIVPKAGLIKFSDSDGLPNAEVSAKPVSRRSRPPPKTVLGSLGLICSGLVHSNFLSFPNPYPNGLVWEFLVASIGSGTPNAD